MTGGEYGYKQSCKYFEQIKHDFQQWCGRIDGNSDIKKYGKRQSYRSGHGPAYRRKGLIFIKGLDFYPKVSPEIWIVRKPTVSH